MRRSLGRAPDSRCPACRPGHAAGGRRALVDGAGGGRRELLARAARLQHDRRPGGPAAADRRQPGLQEHQRQHGDRDSPLRLCELRDQPGVPPVERDRAGADRPGVSRGRRPPLLLRDPATGRAHVDALLLHPRGDRRDRSDHRRGLEQRADREARGPDRRANPEAAGRAAAPGRRPGRATGAPPGERLGTRSRPRHCVSPGRGLGDGRPQGLPAHDPGQPGAERERDVPVPPLPAPGLGHRRPRGDGLLVHEHRRRAGVVRPLRRRGDQAPRGRSQSRARRARSPRSGSSSTTSSSSSSPGVTSRTSSAGRPSWRPRHRRAKPPRGRSPSAGTPSSVTPRNSPATPRSGWRPPMRWPPAFGSRLVIRGD